jgi:hypothetical protein
MNNTFKFINLFNIQLDNTNLNYLKKFLFIEFKKLMSQFKNDNELKIKIFETKNSQNNNIKTVNTFNNNSNNILKKEKENFIATKVTKRKSKYKITTNSESTSKIIDSVVSKNLRNILSEKLADTKFFIRNKNYFNCNKVSKNYYISNKKRKIMSQEKYLEKQDKLNNFGFLSKNQMISSVNDIKHLLLKTMNTAEKAIFLIKDRNYIEFINLFENQNINVETKDEKNNSLLNLAVQSNSYEIVKFLIMKGATPNTYNIFLNTPLHYALTYHNYQIADLLIEAGANEKSTNRFGVTPWQCIESINSVI